MRELGILIPLAILSACDDGGSTAADMLVGCGNGVIEAGEQCDDGNTAAGDGCSALCQFEADAACGDGNLDDGEACDDGNTDNGDGCDENCALEPQPACGDGNLDDGEACDDGNTDNGDGCDENCALEPQPACGDGNLDDGEACDDGNTDNGDGCDENCALEPQPACGDGNLDDGEACDDGNTDNGDGCDENCALEPQPACGDGNLDDGEACDDGNTDNGDGCDENCALEPQPACGDGNLDDGEACDDGNTDNGDGCDENCALEAECGNGDVEDGEACDDGNRAPADGCSPDCQEEADCINADDCDGEALCVRSFCVDEAPPVVCGDGFVEGDEQCDDANVEGGDGCDANCQVELPDPVCGNGVVEAGEACDDGNLDGDDGCNAECQVEGCGNGLIEAGEGCDDGNLDAGDGCDADCQLEPVCGDGAVEGDETCDDGNLDAGDGCDAQCQIEAVCGDRVIEGAETCDDGNDRPGDGCDPGCQLEDGIPLAPLDLCVAVMGDLTPINRFWERPTAGCNPGDGNLHVYEAFRFTNTTPEPQFITAQANFNSDGFLHVFRPPFVADMLDLQNGCVAGNDDIAVGRANTSFIDGVEVPPGETIVVVASTSAPGRAINDYSLEVCTAPAPPPPVCGDGALERGEQCDDGNLDGGDGCDAACALEQPDAVDIAGRGEAIELAGSIDDGDLIWNRPFAECGRGVGLRPYDVYRITNNTGADQRLTVTASWAGDGYLHVFEDPFDPEDRSGCIAGNDDFGGVGGSRVSDVNIPAGATLVVVATTFGPGAIGAYTIEVRTEHECGDGLLGEGVEQCDDGNLDDGDGCDAQCQREPICGDGVVDGAEACDDGNLDNDDGCDDACRVEATCGNGVPEPGEACDDGNLDAGDGCSPDCLLELDQVPIAARDASIELAGSVRVPGFAWERPAANCDPEPGDDHLVSLHAIVNETDSPQRLRLTARWAGDGYLHVFRRPFGPDNCVIGDDDFVIDGNARELASRIEEVPIAPGEGLVVVASTFAPQVEIGDYTIEVYTLPVCGDGVVHTGEACDDGNLDGGDGCAADCTVEPMPGALAAPGESIELVGSIDAQDEQWERPAEDCSAQPGDLHFFEAHTLVNDSDAPQAIQITAFWNGDGFLHAFRQPFDPADLGTCVVGDDDEALDGNPALAASRIVSVELAPGEAIVIVASTFAPNAAIGDYRIEVVTLASECGNRSVEVGETCDDGNDVNGDGCDAACTAEVVELIRGRETHQNATAAGQWDDYRFHVDQADTRVTASTGDGRRGCPVDADTTIALFPENPDGSLGERIAFDDDGGEGRCSRLDASLDAGDYVLRVQGPDEEPAAIPGYTLDFLLAVDVTDGGDFAGEIPANGSDVFTATFEVDTLVAFETGDGQGGCPSNTAINVFRVSDGQRRPPPAFDEDGGVFPCARIAQFVPAGTYEIEVEGFFDFPADAYVFSVRFAGLCGDGEINALERCDDGNLENGDGCNDRCEVEPTCGDGRPEAPEQCDDGNLEDGDGCDSSCVLELPDPIDIAEAGATIELAGSIDEGDPGWYRLTETCEVGPSTRDYIGPLNPFDFYRITNNTGADQRLTLTAAWAGDGFLYVFEEPFAPQVPVFNRFGRVAGCVIGNDDFNGREGSRLVDVSIAAGETVFVLGSSYDNALIGAYTIEVLTQPE